MILGYLVLFTALVISAVAIYYSVAGLAAIFAAAVIPIVIMGVALEAGKLVTAVWLHRYWKQAAWWLKTYLSIAVFVLMFITSMGIFGFLSKAHIEQTASVGNNSLQVELLEQRIAREQKRISDADLVISQLDKAVQVLLDNDRIRGQNGAIAIRESQKDERASLNAIIEEAQSSIASLQEEKLILEKQQVAIEAEVGPIKYIAEFIYGTEADKNLLEEAVRWVIIILIFVFDPLAVLLLIASQYTFEFHRKEREAKANLVKEIEGNNDDNESLSTNESATFSLLKTNSDAGASATTTTIEDLQNDIPVEKTDVDADAGIREVGTENTVSSDAETGNGLEQSEVQFDGLPQSEEEQRRLEQYEEKEQDAAFVRSKTQWKEANPDKTLKHYKHLYIKGIIDQLPWEESAKTDNYTVEGYQQNGEQNEKTLFNKLRK
jgi:hypothetical protein